MLRSMGLNDGVAALASECGHGPSYAWHQKFIKQLNVMHNVQQGRSTTDHKLLPMPSLAAKQEPLARSYYPDLLKSDDTCIKHAVSSAQSQPFTCCMHAPGRYWQSGGPV